MHACNVIADIAVKITWYFLYFFYLIDEVRSVLIAEFEFAEK